MNWLKDIRKTENLTQFELADKAGISRAYYTHVENGDRRPSVDVAKRLGAILGFDWTLFYEPDPAEEIAQEA